MEVLSRGHWLPLLLVAGAVASCTPSFDDQLSLVDSPRLLAVRVTPPEAAPREAVRFEALLSDPDVTVEWATCGARKPLTELGPVSARCLTPDDPALTPLGAGQGVEGLVLEDACRRFGPQLPEPEPGQPSGRPSDADATGGYYQPVRARLPQLGATSFGAVRLVCDTSGATRQQTVELGARGRRNHHPEASLLLAQRADASEVALSQEVPLEVSPGERLTLRLGWPSCPSPDVCGDGVCGIDDARDTCPEDCAAPVGCGGAERYVTFDTTTRRVVERREAITVSWFATGGRFDSERTGREETDLEVTTDVRWTAPRDGEVRLWAVLRDSRGGVGWRTQALHVRR